VAVGWPLRSKTCTGCRIAATDKARLFDQINARTNGEGLPIGIVITPGQAHDVTAFPALMQEIDCDPEQMLGDKGYDSEAVRSEIEQRGGEAAIPSTATGKYSMSCRVATRYDKLIESFAAFVLLACIRIWIKFVHAANPLPSIPLDAQQ
jgi:transposase